MKVMVMGAGGVGGYLGALLARAGHRVTVLARGAHLDALQQDGLRIESTVENAFTVPVRALPAPEAGQLTDLVMVAVKAYDLDDAIARVRPAVGSDTTVLTLLNGVESGEKLAASFGPARVLDGVMYIESFIKSPGVIAQTGGPRRVVFGNRSGPNGERENALLSAFSEAGWNVELTDNILGSLWSKFAYLGPFAAVNTVTGLGSARLCSTDVCSRLMETVVSEYIAVGNAEGADLSPDTLETVMGRYRGSIVSMTSMLRDRVAGKRIESEALVGSVVRRGRALGVPTPTTEHLYCLLAPMAQGNAAQLGIA